jgi:hypothetical protein
MLLGERLHELRLVRRAHLGEALQAQHLHGGRLGTNLVQLGHLELDALATALGAHLSVPVAVESQFAAVRERVLARLPADVAARVGAVPVNETKAGTLIVAMLDPRDHDALAAIERAVGGRIQACVAPELRIAYWLEKHYGVPRDPRFLRGDVGEVPVAERARERRRTIPPVPPLEPKEQAQRLGRITTIKRVLPQRAPTDDLELDITVDARRRSPAAEAGLARLASARMSDDLAHALCDYLAGAVGCGFILMVRGQAALTWRAAPPLDAKTASLIAVPLDLPTAFRVACETGTTFHGQPPEKARAWHDRLVGMLGHKPPRDLVIVPIHAGERVLALIYAHMNERDFVPPQVLGDLEALAEGVSAALVRLAG